MTQKFNLDLHNITCASCVKSIESTLSKISGILDANVNFAQRTVCISGNIAPDIAISALKKAGFHASLVSETDSSHSQNQQMQQLRSKTLVAGIMGSILLLLSFSPWQPSLTDLYGQITWFIIGLIALFGIWYSGRHFYKGAYNSFKNHNATMDTLICLGTGAAWFYSMIVCLRPELVPENTRHMYFETALIIIALVNLGAFLETRARGKTSQSIKRLINLQAKTARRMLEDDKYEDVPIESLKVGDIIRVRPGEIVPVDGKIHEGRTTIDESMLTGESMPISKEINDTVFGSTLNKSGSILFKATKIGKDTALAQIIKLVKNAQNTKPPIAKLADIASAFFVPGVIIISIITCVVWFNLGYSPGFILVASITVLVIACPCALGLAAPISVIVGMGKAAEYGVLIRNGDALQKASQLNTVVLDKTGTITKGQPEVVDIITANNCEEDLILQLSASLEEYSEHPLGRAIIDRTKQKNISLKTIQDFKSTAGKGIQATIDNKSIILGNDKMMLENNIEIISIKDTINEHTALGQTPVYFAFNKILAGVIFIADPIKDDVKKSIQIIQKLGIEVIMITGDNKNTAQAVAKQVGIKKVYAEVLPHEKSEKIQSLQKDGNIVAMVGDGINDAPALTSADVGFAISSGTDVAIESADITLVRNSIQGVVNAISISKATMLNIKQNLFGAFIYNIIGIPIAAGVIYPFIGILLNPMIAGAAMAASSLTVVSNANRLRLFKVKRDNL